MKVGLQQEGDLRRNLEVYQEFIQAQALSSISSEPAWPEDESDTELPVYKQDSSRFLNNNGKYYFITSSERFETV